ncbi:hypothetical protein Hanom_Chr14g01266741 [Helianthus anomalus]
MSLLLHVPEVGSYRHVIPDNMSNKGHIHNVGSFCASLKLLLYSSHCTMVTSSRNQKKFIEYVIHVKSSKLHTSIPDNPVCNLLSSTSTPI